MADLVPIGLKQVLSEKLAESLSGPPLGATPRRIFGATGLRGKASAVIGMRRVGKTTLLHQLRGERLERGVDPSLLPYVNFEDERLVGLEAGQLGFLIEEHNRRVPAAAAGATVTWCFDEIQVVPGWERFVRRLLDTGDVEVFVTGSSAALLSREIATAMRGRAWEVLLHPFSFEEALRHQGHAIPHHLESLTGQQRAQLERALLRWLETGGFPEAQDVDAATRRQLLRDYVDVAMLRDVVERHGVSNVAGLRWLVRHLLGNAASMFSVQKFYAALKSQGIAISKDTVHQLLAQIEDCFLVRTVWMESASERQRMVNLRKAYPIDSGLSPIFDSSGRLHPGHALETAVMIELERRRAAVTYVRTPGGFEVDFLARMPDGEVQLVQVCADAADPATATRELRALDEAAKQFPEARCRLLTLTRDGMPAEAPAGVTVQPVYEWLLSLPP